MTTIKGLPWQALWHFVELIQPYRFRKLSKILKLGIKSLLNNRVSVFPSVKSSVIGSGTSEFVLKQNTVDTLLRLSITCGPYNLHSRPQSCDPFGQCHGSRALVGSESRKSANQIGYKNGQLLRLTFILAPARALDPWPWPKGSQLW